MSLTMGSYMTPSSGLYTSQTSLYVTNNNISNVNTSGYTRQQAIACDMNPYSQGIYQVGGGVDLQQVRQIRSSFMDKSYRSENSSLGYWEAQAGVVNDIESVLGTFSEGGIYASIDDFFHAWEELSKNPESLTTRAMVVEYGVAFVDTINQIDEQFSNIQEDICSQIISTVDEMNKIAQDIAEFNVKIMECQAMDVEANDYNDQRNFLLDQLSYFADIKVIEQPNGMMNVLIGGSYLVNGRETNNMEIENLGMNGRNIEIQWEKSGENVQVEDGKLEGLMDCIGASESIINETREALDALVYTMAEEINSIHSMGFGLNGSTGINFFLPIDASQSIGCGNIQVNSELNDLNKVAVSKSGEPGDNKVANKIVDFRNKECFEYEGFEMNVDDYYSSFTAWIGTVGQEAIAFADNQRVLMNQIQAQRQSLSAVSIDEEMNNMIMYQQAYNANAKVLKVIDEMIDTIINKIGAA